MLLDRPQAAEWKFWFLKEYSLGLCFWKLPMGAQVLCRTTWRRFSNASDIFSPTQKGQRGGKHINNLNNVTHQTHCIEEGLEQRCAAWLEQMWNVDLGGGLHLLHHSLVLLHCHQHSGRHEKIELRWGESKHAELQATSGCNWGRNLLFFSSQESPKRASQCRILRLFLLLIHTLLVRKTQSKKNPKAEIPPTDSGQLGFFN